MKSNKKSEKSVYLTPKLQCIKIDQMISLALNSLPPAGPDETFTNCTSISSLESQEANIRYTTIITKTELPHKPI